MGARRDRRAPRLCEDRLRRLGRPGRGRPDRATARSRSTTTAGSPRSGRASELGEGERFDGCVIVPGFVNCHSHLEYAVYAGFGDGLPFAPWIGLHVARKRLLDARRHARRSPSSAARRVPPLGRHDGRRLQLLRRRGGGGRARPGLRAIVYLEVFGARRDRARALRASTRRGSEPVLSDRVRLGVSPHAPYTCTLELYEAVRRARAADRDAPRGERAPSATYLVDGGGRLVGVRRAARRRRPGRRASGCWPRPGLLGPRVLAAHCVHVDEEEIALLAAHGVGVAHCPRSNGFLGCGDRAAPRAARRRDRASGSRPTARPRRRPSTCSRSCGRRSSPRGRGSSGPTRSPRRARSSSRRSAAPGCSASSTRSARSCPASQADLAVVSLEGSPLDPVEDPAAAVVLGGSPDRVAATLVAGEDRYRRGTSAWPDTTRAARSARSRMLR